MDFDVKGPYIIKRFGSAKMITDESLNALKKDIDVDLADGCGCYVFAIRASKGYKPWYIGQASASRLLPEAMNPSNREKFNKIVTEKKGTPVLFFLPKLTKTGMYAAPTTKEDKNLQSVNFLEEWLIATALQKNPNLMNKQNTFFLKNLHVTGLFNPRHGEATVESSDLKSVLY
jgi:hypothetical protein